MKSAQFNHGEMSKKTLFHKDINLLVFQICLTRTDTNYIYHRPLLMFYSVISEGRGNYSKVRFGIVYSPWSGLKNTWHLVKANKKNMVLFLNSPT